MAGIYLHIPFCKQACHYCDFHFSTNQENKSKLAECIARELLLQKGYIGEEVVNTIYFGGGTPSLLSATELNAIFNSIHNNFKLDADAEVTLEANPDDLNPGLLKTLLSAGINRLSIGIQSFDDEILRYLNRAHSATEAETCVHQSRLYGFDNISIDLIYAIPGQSMDQWNRNIERATALNPEHISAYSLTIEKKTAFGNWFEKGKLIPVEDDLAAAQLETLIDELSKKGYEHYEISNFSKPGLHSRHNSSYWSGQKYLGVGPGAHSYNSVSRQFNVANNSLYISSLTDDKIPFEIETLSREDHINEYLLTSLRTNRGADLSLMVAKFNYDLVVQNKEYIDSILLNKVAVIEKGFLKLTGKGRLLADKISSDLFVVV
jgi:oxygen-independent coproporphyrinogen-3 oxidase